jgi:hypothetical protein
VARAIFCANCAYYASFDGECRRHAPGVKWFVDVPETSERLGFHPLWPSVNRRDWCGEFREALEVDDEES